MMGGQSGAIGSQNGPVDRQNGPVDRQNGPMTGPRRCSTANASSPAAASHPGASQGSVGTNVVAITRHNGNTDPIVAVRPARGGEGAGQTEPMMRLA